MRRCHVIGCPLIANHTAGWVPQWETVINLCDGHARLALQIVLAIDVDRARSEYQASEGTELDTGGNADRSTEN